jgi:hypothetical protein
MSSLSTVNQYDYVTRCVGSKLDSYAWSHGIETWSSQTIISLQQPGCYFRLCEELLFQSFVFPEIYKLASLHAIASGGIIDPTSQMCGQTDMISPICVHFMHIVQRKHTNVENMLPFAANKASLEILSYAACRFNPSYLVSHLLGADGSEKYILKLLDKVTQFSVTFTYN